MAMLQISLLTMRPYGTSTNVLTVFYCQEQSDCMSPSSACKLDLHIELAVSVLTVSIVTVTLDQRLHLATAVQVASIKLMIGHLEPHLPCRFWPFLDKHERKCLKS